MPVDSKFAGQRGITLSRYRKTKHKQKSIVVRLPFGSHTTNVYIKSLSVIEGRMTQFKIETSENNITMETESTARKSVKVIAIWIVLGIALGATYGNVAMGLIVGVVVGAIFRSLRSRKTN